MPSKEIISIVRSGGQTGTDRAALLAGKDSNYPICGWCPRGGWAEDLTEEPGLVSVFPEMVETPSEEILQRTDWNVRDSHVTIVIGSSKNSFGTEMTIKLAKLYTRKILVVEKQKPIEVLKWLEDNVGRGLTVNFAGPRESENPGIQEKSYAFIMELLKLNSELADDSLAKLISSNNAKHILTNTEEINRSYQSDIDIEDKKQVSKDNIPTKATSHTDPFDVEFVIEQNHALVIDDDNGSKSCSNDFETLEDQLKSIGIEFEVLDDDDDMDNN